ncbi:glycosyltransferase family 2 protein [uncultured Lutibacter sp.]|uniref:glycosyltransferase family 2 protein n=1 Tax=uncultured Lutibacter sp. TaxID=437739 RepID=UPI00262C320C|nr:glycosyltransferase family 2 protein [uncultured Lutibacter sp.]
MNHNPLISIVIPTYNSAKTITQTLESILFQTYVNIEVIVVDSLSSDATCELVNEFKLTHSNIILISEKDKGVYDAMNKGIKLAKGDFLYFMGSDDVFYNKNTLANIFVVDNIKYDVIYGNVEFKFSKKIYSGESSLVKLINQQISICHQAIFYSKKTFKLVGNYNLKYFIHADYDFNIRCFQNRELKIKYIEIIVAIFNETGLSGTKSNADGFHTELTIFNEAHKYNIIELYAENQKLKKTLKRVTSSKPYRLGTFILKPLKKIKKILFK